ncbi:MAG TPA: penicillin-binding protein activator [Xanthobacteraceae bacterium]|nr:penicillin-binding protein activator [Xanthobacteraceae bacterium]
MVSVAYSPAGGLARARGARAASIVAFCALLLAGCAGQSGGPQFDSVFGDAPQDPMLHQQAQQPMGNPAGVRVGLILPLSASGNAGAAAQSMRNAAELALAEFGNPNIQLIVKDDGGNAHGAQMSAEQALTEGAEIVLGPLFSHAVAAAGQTTRNRGVPMIAFSTDANVAARGVYLLSFLPETDVERVTRHAIANKRRSFIALLPDNAYGTVVEGTFKQVVASGGGRIVALEHYPNDPARIAETVKKVAGAARIADAVFIADAADVTPQIVQALVANGVSPRRLKFMGTGLWDDPKLFSDPNLQGAWFAAPDATGFRNFATRYRARFGAEPARTASLAYDAVSLVAALVKTQGPNRFSEEILTNPSGFAGTDGVFRFKRDGTSERGLAIMEIHSGSARVVSPAPTTFATSALSN